jgi:hypothetical protein
LSQKLISSDSISRLSKPQIKGGQLVPQITGTFW